MQNNAAGLSFNWRLGLVLLGCLQTMFCAGLVFGWASIAGTLLVAPLEDGGANLSMDETTVIFSLAASTSSLSLLILGYVLDAHGPRMCSLVAHSFIGAGCLLFSHASHFHGILCATCLIAFGGPGIQSAVIHLANLFPNQKFTVMSIISGSITLSFAVLPMFDIVWEHYAIGIRTLFRSYTAIICFSALGSQCFWTDTPFEVDADNELWPEDDDEGGVFEHPSSEDIFLGAVSHTQLVEAPLNSYLRPNTHNQLSSHDSFNRSVNALASGNHKAVSIKDQPFLNQLLSGTYFRTVLPFVATSFMANFFVASLPTELADNSAFPIEVQHYLARTFTLITSIGILASFLIGWLMDRIGLEACAVLTLVMGQLHMIVSTTCTGMFTPMIVGFFIYTLFRSFLFPVFIATLSSRLGFKYFGILSGLGFAVSGLTQLFIAPLVRKAKGDCHLHASEECSHGHWRELHIIQFCILFVLWMIPVAEKLKSSSSSPGKPLTRNPEQLTTTMSSDYGSINENPSAKGEDSDRGILE